ncbi:MAG: peptidylprolyl isomerase [Geitlerinemataceae cyanobacterium]
MVDLFQVGNRAIEAHEIPALLRRYQMMSQFLRELVIDDVIADYSCTEEEAQTALVQFYQQHQLTTPEAIESWLKSQGMTSDQLKELAVRPALIGKFKQAKFVSKVQSYFMERKSHLDFVVYSLLRTKEEGLAHELYYRIQEGEQSFADCASEYSQGPEARNGGRLGPVPIVQPHPAISKLLSVSQPGQLWAPRQLAEWFILIRLEEFHPAQLDGPMRQRLLDELFQRWLQEETQKISISQPQ